MGKAQTRQMVLSALFMALALLLPLLTAQLQAAGQALLPMHLPVLLCGFVCGPLWGLLVGAVAPLLRSVVFGMPPMMPVAVAMAFELAAYGAVSGLLMLKSPKTPVFTVIALVGAMVAGRIVWGVAMLLLMSLGSGAPFTWAAFAAGAVLNAIPGIVIQLVLIPAIIVAIRKADKSLK